MELRTQILKEHTKANCEAIVRWVGSDQEKFDELFRLFLHDEYRVVQRSAWPLSYCVMANPGLIRKHCGKFVQNLRKPGIHDAVKRNSVRLLQDIAIPRKYQGAIMDTCFGFLGSATETVAVKVFSIAVLGKLARSYPGIIPELSMIIEDQLPRQSAAFKSRARKFLKTVAAIPKP